ncbi:MAG: chemotaxis response regulator protein-glutamate methylesterase [Lachnospiraceae bacterium]|nr:chemotaxis response regulator protein-glutamate methylesterase [Lachnospiraceae bacterium]
MGKKILVVDDSALMRKVACDIIERDNRYDKPERCRDGQEALDLVKKNKYDAIVLDVNMPKLDGISFLRKLKEEGLKEHVMMFSTTTGEGTKQTMEALELGAMDFIKKPDSLSDISGEDFAEHFLTMLAVVSGAGSALSPSRKRETAEEIKAEKTSSPVSLRPSLKVDGDKLIAIASSTGGPKALHSVIPMIPAKINAPIIIVQHMPMGFTKSLAERLDSLSKVKVKEAEEGDLLEKGHVYIAPGDKHMKVAKSGGHTRIYFTNEPKREGVRPCANYMYESIADTAYKKICCVVLTGMGADGTAGIKDLVKHKQLHIISQDEESCAVYGMPRAIANTGLVNEVLPLTKIADAITKEVGLS